MIKPIDNTAGRKSLLLQVYLGDEISEDKLAKETPLLIDVGEATPAPLPLSPLITCLLIASVLASLGLITYLIYGSRRRQR